ncbi:MAG: DUF2851 family protein [Bacteroidales bacterium]|nr:DUF2851 family protein [Bacteroidales bacterium]
MNEAFLIYLWENKLLKSPLKTTHGQNIEVLYPGVRNHHSGPDFHNARIRIGETLWAGNVEMHINASDWYKHQHHLDKAYSSLILHVVFKADKEVYDDHRQTIPALEIDGCFDTSILLRYRSFIDSRKWIACEKSVSSIQRFTWLSWLDRMVVERLVDKTIYIQEQLEQTANDWEEVFYRRLMQNFGFKVNDAAFDLLARSLPFHLLLRHADQLFQLEALLFGQAGLLEVQFNDDYPENLRKEYQFLSSKYQLKPLKAEIWRFMRMRPVNFPTIRLSQIAAIIHQNGQLFSKVLHANDVEQVKKMFSVKASVYWNNHFRFDKESVNSEKQMGKNALELILINTVAQVLFAYGRIRGEEKHLDSALLILESIEAEQNSIINRFSDLGLSAINALQSQALLHMREHFCKPRRCLECHIGQALIKEAT